MTFAAFGLVGVSTAGVMAALLLVAALIEIVSQELDAGGYKVDWADVCIAGLALICGANAVCLMRLLVRVGL